GRGDDEIGVSASLWCDASAFEAALAAGDLARALELYRGDFLEGFHVAGAPEYQDWLDRNRSRLRDLAAGAARTLADDLAGLDRPEEALAYARRALDLDPHDEPALRRLVTLLDASGDRAAALRALDDFTRRLAAELDLEPSEETRGLRAGIAKGSRDAGHGSRDAGHGSRVTGHGSRGAADGGRDAG